MELFDLWLCTYSSIFRKACRQHEVPVREEMQESLYFDQMLGG